MRPDPEEPLSPQLLVVLLRDQLEAFSVLADRIALVREATATGSAPVAEVKEAEDTVRWLQRQTRAILRGFENDGDEEGPRTDVAAAARRTVRRWSRTMPNLDVSVDVDRGTWVVASAAVLERVLQGLVSRAGRRARRGVRVVASVAGNEVELVVEDDGPPPDGAHPTEGVEPGSDVELALLRWLVRRAGGSLFADAGPGSEGCGVRVRLRADPPPGRRDGGS